MSSAPASARVIRIPEEMNAFFVNLFRSKKNRLITGGALVLLLGIIATAAYYAQTAIPSSIQNPTAHMFQVSRGNLSTTISGTGKLISENVDSLSFSTEGIVEVLNVKVGQLVKKGDVLAGLKNTEKLTLEVENKELALQIAEEAIQDLKTAEESYGIKPSKQAERSISDITADIGENKDKIESLEKRRERLCRQNEEANLRALGIDPQQAERLAEPVVRAVPAWQDGR